MWQDVIGPLQLIKVRKITTWNDNRRRMVLLGNFATLLRNFARGCELLEVGFLETFAAGALRKGLRNFVGPCEMAILPPLVRSPLLKFAKACEMDAPPCKLAYLPYSWLNGMSRGPKI